MDVDEILNAVLGTRQFESRLKVVLIPTGTVFELAMQ
jgi:hypothetical protein